MLLDILIQVEIWGNRASMEMLVGKQKGKRCQQRTMCCLKCERGEEVLNIQP